MNSRLKSRADQIRRFLGHDVWRDPPEAGCIRLALLHAARVLLITANSIRNETILLRASALSYSTLLAVVPALAIGFSMLKGLGLQSRIEYVLIRYLTAKQEQLTSQILGYISNTDFKALGALGTAVLICAVIMMLSNVEQAFNTIWGVSRSRPLVRKISDYISVLLLGPLLIVLSTAMITSLSSHTVVQSLSEYTVFRDFFFLFKMVIPHLGLWVAFTAMYILMPNTRVRLVPALIAGVIFGSAWELAFHVYTDFNIGVARYNKIYGTFAALPVFIIWIYISWVIVLVGAQISNAIQHIRAYQQEFAATDASFGQKQSMALYIMHETARRFYLGRLPATAEELSRRFAIPPRLVGDICDILCRRGLMRIVDGETGSFQPAMDLSRIRPADVFEAVRDCGQSGWQVPEAVKNQDIEDMIETYRASGARALEGLTIGEMVSADPDASLES